MQMTEICIEKAANGFTIECEYKPKAKAMKAESAYGSEKKLEYIATSEADLIKVVKKLVGKLSTEMESEQEES
ncbi:MAG: hypothetical protein R8K20_08570 [Gallionellaceae bacterium]